MPVTPLHLGVGLPIRALVGKKYFGIWSFFAVQVLYDLEPLTRMVFDLDGTLHQTTHNPLFGSVYALVTILCLWRWERVGAITGAVWGAISHLWLDALYHSDVAAGMARWGVENHRGFDAEVICMLGFGLWLLIAGIRKAIEQRSERRRSSAA